MLIIDEILKKIFLFFIKIYQKTLSPDKGIFSSILKGKICCHKPHCSQYATDCLNRYGFFKGIGKTMSRISSCTGGTKKKYDPHFYKIVFFCSSPIGIRYLNELKDDKRFEIVGIICSPDKASDRGMKVKSNIIKKKATDIGIKQEIIKTPQKISSSNQEGQEFVNWLKNLKPDFLITLAYGKILKKEILEIPKIAPINIHGSLLPAYRGASPIQSVFLNQENYSGITIMKMDETMDTGNIIDQKKCKLKFDRTAKDLIDRMIDNGPKFLTNTIWNYGKGLLGEVAQDNSKASYCKKIKKEDGYVDIKNDSIKNIYKKYKGYYLWPKIYFFWGKSGKQIRFTIEKLKIKPGLYVQNKNLSLIKNNILNEAVQEIEIKPEGKKTIKRNAFINGYLK